MNRFALCHAALWLLLLPTACAKEEPTTDEHEHASEAHAHEHDEAEGHARHVSIPDDALEPNGVVMAHAVDHIVRREIELPGEIILDPDRVAHVVPRFPGIVQQVNKSLGDRVRAGEVVAIVQSNVSAAPYEIKALINGMVVEKHVTMGEYVRDDADIFVIADLSVVWVNISVYARFLPVVKTGQHVRITSTGLKEEASGTIDYIGPIIGESTRTGVARMTLANRHGTWQPGLFVTAQVAVDETLVDVAVPESAIQTVGGHEVVFVHVGDSYEVREIEAGRRGGGWIEVTSGLAAGEEFVSEGTFIFKAELEKSEAGHQH
jgi:membrane fusion protein, heavy metal efflux system